MSNRVSINKLCRKCMCELKNEDAKCGVCGFDRVDYSVPREHLRLDCILKGKYLTGICIRETDNEKTYAGWNLSYDTKVVIKEYFPKELVSREDYESGNVIVKKNAYSEIFKNNITKYINQAELQSFNDGKKVNITETFQENGTAYYIISCVSIDNMASKIEVDMAASYELVKPSEFETPNDSDNNIQRYQRFNGVAGKSYVQPAFHVQPAKSNSTLSAEEKVVKNIAPNVLSGANVSYVKIMRSKSDSLSMDLEEELEKTRTVDDEVKYNSSTSTMSFDGGASRSTNEDTKSEDGNKMSAVSNDGGIGESDNGIVKIFKWIDKNKTISAIAFVAVLFIIVGVKLMKNGNNDGVDEAMSTKSASQSTTQKPSDTPSDSQASKGEVEATDNNDAVDNDKKFEFSDPEGALALQVASQIGKEVEELTYADIIGIEKLDLKGKEISDVSDLREFTGLKWLDLSKNPLVDVSILNELKDTLEFLNLADSRELVEQVPDIAYVVGRSEPVTINFHYKSLSGLYDDKALWVWTVNPGSQLSFTVDDGEGIASNMYTLLIDRHIGFKVKKAGVEDWSEVDGEYNEDRQFVCPSNKPGDVINVYIVQNQVAFDVEVEHIGK